MQNISTISKNTPDIPKKNNKTNSNIKSPKIAWEYWIDPYGDNIDLLNPISEEQELENFDANEYERIGDLKEKQNNQQGLFTKKPYKLAITQIGVIPFYEHSLPSRIFKFWVGHTNFNISPKVAKTIEDTNGVETLDIFTRYRFRVGIAKIFDSKEVRKDIERNIYKILKNKTTI